MYRVTRAVKRQRAFGKILAWTRERSGLRFFVDEKTGTNTRKSEITHPHERIIRRRSNSGRNKKKQKRGRKLYNSDWNWDDTNRRTHRSAGGKGEKNKDSGTAALVFPATTLQCGSGEKLRITICTYRAHNYIYILFEVCIHDVRCHVYEIMITMIIRARRIARRLGNGRKNGRRLEEEWRLRRTMKKIYILYERELCKMLYMASDTRSE